MNSSTAPAEPTAGPPKSDIVDRAKRRRPLIPIGPGYHPQWRRQIQPRPLTGRGTCCEAIVRSHGITPSRPPCAADLGVLRSTPTKPSPAAVIKTQQRLVSVSPPHNNIINASSRALTGVNPSRRNGEISVDTPVTPVIWVPRGRPQSLVSNLQPTIVIISTHLGRSCLTPDIGTPSNITNASVRLTQSQSRTGKVRLG